MKKLLTKEMMAIVAIAMIGILFTGSAQAQDANDPNANNLFDVNRVLTLNITMDPCDWEIIRNFCPSPDGHCDEFNNPYYQATLQCGTQGPMLIGIHRKSDIGEPNNTDPQKVSLKLDINRYVGGQLFAGKKKLSLELGASGAVVTEGLSWHIYGRTGIVSGRSAWVNVYVNDDYKGLYSNVEQIDKTFLADNGIDNRGWLYKREDYGEEQRTHEDPFLANPFQFNWYPFDHPESSEVPETIPPPADWLDQAQWRVNMPHLLKLAVAENFVANADALVMKGARNYWYYDWSTNPNDINDPNFQQPRLYFVWDLDTVFKSSDFSVPIMNAPSPFGGGPFQEGLINEVNESGVPFGYPTHQADYLDTYADLLDGPLELSSLIGMVNDIESVISTDLDADPYGQLGMTAAEEFQRIRDYLTARTASVNSQLDALIPPPGIYLLDDGFEGTPWDANWTGAWTDETTRVRTGSHAAGADRGGGTGYFTSDALDANDATAIHIRCYVQQDSAATFTLEYNGSGGWSAPIDLTALGGDEEWLYYGDTITDSNYFVPDFKIRFNAAFSGGGARSVEVDDVVITKEIGETPCDAANLDGIDPVNFKDYVILANDWQLTGPGLAGDIDANDVVNFGDLDWMFDYWLIDCGQ